VTLKLQVAEAKRYIKRTPTALCYYRVMQNVIIKYDLNSFARHDGELYDALKDVYEELGLRWPLNSLTSVELVQLALHLICEMEKIECPPIWSKDNDDIEIQDLTVDLKTVLERYKTWVRGDVKMTVQRAKKLVSRMKTSKKSYKANQDNISKVKHDLADVDEWAPKALQALENADLEGSTGHQRNTRKHLLSEINEIISAKDCITQELNDIKFGTDKDDELDENPFE
jgi:hypothetical protein